MERCGGRGNILSGGGRGRREGDTGDFCDPGKRSKEREPGRDKKVLLKGKGECRGEASSLETVKTEV